MTIDEAIAHAEWCADNSCGECAEEHRQLAEWLRELRDIRSENAKLRELARRLLTEYRYMRSRPRRVYLGHERRMRVIEDEMRELGIEVADGR